MKLWHATFRAHLPAILQHGLRPKRPAQWHRADGAPFAPGIYAFDTEVSAILWAGKMAWEYRDTDPEIWVVAFESEAPWISDGPGSFVQPGSWRLPTGSVPPEALLSLERVTPERLRAAVEGRNAQIRAHEPVVQEAL